MRIPFLDVAVAVLVYRREAWIQRRKSDDHLCGCWEFPGGKIQSAEPPRSALLREVREEVGLSLDPHLPRLVLIQPYLYPNQAVRIFFFLCRLNSRHLRSEGRWVKNRDLARFRLPPANRRVLEVLAHQRQ